MPHQPMVVSHRVVGFAMIAAPLLLLASDLVYTAGDGLGEDSAGGAIQVYAMAAWFLVLVGLTRLVEAPFPRLAAALLVVGSLGVAGGVAWGLDAIFIDETGANVEDLGTAGVLTLNIPGILFPLALLGLGLALIRAVIEPRWAGMVLAVAAILFPISRIGNVEALAIADDVLFIVALAPLGWAILQGRDAMPSAAPPVGAAVGP